MVSQCFCKKMKIWADLTYPIVRNRRNPIMGLELEGCGGTTDAR